MGPFGMTGVHAYNAVSKIKEPLDGDIDIRDGDISINDQVALLVIGENAKVGELVDNKEMSIGIKVEGLIGIEFSRFRSILESAQIQEDRLITFINEFLDRKFTYVNTFVGEELKMKLQAFDSLRECIPDIVLFHMCSVLLLAFENYSSRKDDCAYLKILHSSLEKRIVEFFKENTSKSHGVGYEILSFFLKAEVDFLEYIKSNFFPLYNTPKYLGKTWTYNALFEIYLSFLSEVDRKTLLHQIQNDYV